MFFRLLAVWFMGHGKDNYLTRHETRQKANTWALSLLPETIQPVFKTVLGSEFPYDPQELIVFALIG
jgi:hypothetical protein